MVNNGTELITQLIFLFPVLSLIGTGNKQQGSFLPITHYPLPITHYPLPITHYPLPITH
jgi:hypothetical protein